MAGSNVYSMWLPEELVARLDAIAAEFGVSRNFVVKMVLESATASGGLSDLRRDLRAHIRLGQKPPHR
jgi:predicted DNA-binding protein